MPTDEGPAPIAVVAYSADWPVRFAAERAALARVYPPDAFTIEHIGSTAVPGLESKPIVDILIGAPSLPQIEARIGAMAALGYEYVPGHEAVLPERRFFAKPAARPRAFHVHAVRADSPFRAEHLRFRDALRADPVLAAEYGALKRRLALRHDADREGYTDAKSAFIRSVVRPLRTVTTPALVLEPQVTAHADAMFGVLSDPAIYEHESAPPPSVAWLRERYRRLETRRSPDGSEQWLNWVVRLPTGELAGYVQATVHADGRAAVAYELASRYWNRGLGRAAVEAMIGELVARHGARTLSAVLKRTNGRSRRLLLRLGFAVASSEAHALWSVEPDEMLMERVARCA